MKEKIIEINDKRIKVKLFKRSKKNIIIKIIKDEIHVSLPKSSTYKRAEQFLTEKIDWIEKRLNNNIKYIKKYNNILFYLGKNYKILEDEKYQNIIFDENTVKINKIERLKDWIRVEADTVIREKYKRISEKTGISAEKIKTKPMKSAWGICYSNGNITFNSLLICLPKEIIEYVIIHELCHRIHMNHSKEFWSLVKEYFPQYKEARLFLKNFSKSIYANNILI